MTADAIAAHAGPGAAAPGPAGAGHVVLDGVGKTFRRAGRRTVALADVSLQVAAGELVCLLGPSGCGKSTLLRIVAGALTADQGTVTAAGQPVTGPAPDLVCRLRHWPISIYSSPIPRPSRHIVADHRREAAA